MEIPATQKTIIVPCSTQTPNFLGKKSNNIQECKIQAQPPYSYLINIPYYLKNINMPVVA